MTDPVTNPNDSAFPRGGGDTPGLTKREYIAAMVLAGFGSSPGGVSLADVPLAVEFADILIVKLNETAR